MARTEGLYIQAVTLGGIPDGGDAELEVVTAAGLPVTVVGLSVSGGNATVDMTAGDVALWPNEIRLKLNATNGNSFKSATVRNSKGTVEFVRNTVAVSTPVMTNTGVTLLGSTHTFTWDDPSPIPGRKYQITIDGIARAGVLLEPATQATVTGIRVNGETFQVDLNAWDNDDLSTLVTSSGTFTAYTQPGSPPSTTEPTLLTPEDLSTATSADVYFSWSGPAGYVYEVVIYYDAARTQKVTGTDGTVYDTVSIGTATSHTFTDDPSDGTTRYGSLNYWPDASYTNGGTVPFQYTAYLDEGGQVLPAFVAPTNGYQAASSTINFQWTGPAGAYYILTIFSNAARSVKKRGIRGELLEAPDLNDATSHTFTTIPNDGQIHYVRLYKYSGAGYTSEVIVDLQYTAFYAVEAYLQAPPALSNLTSISVRVSFTATTFVQAKTEVRPVGGAWVTKANETSFTYQSHIQNITGLTPSTNYEYRVTITGTNGYVLISNIYPFTTNAAEVADDALIMRALMSGSRHHGWRLNHPYLHRSSNVAIRFIQEETGNMIRVSKHNRQGSGYHEGNGGNYLVKIHPSLNDLPDETVVLGSSNPATNFILTDGPSTGSDRIWVDIDSPAAPLVAGTEYWMVWDSRSEAGNGRSVFNASQIGDYYESVSGITDRGPYPGGKDMMLYDKVNKGDAWQSLRPYLIPWVCWEMSSGRIRGNTMYCYYGQVLDTTNNMAASRTIEGSKVARQRFTASRNETVDGLWLFWGHTYYHNIDGSPLTIRVKNSSGTMLAAGSISAIPALSTIARNGEAAGDLEARATRTWGYTDFTSDVNFVAGQVYDIEFSSGSQGGFALTAIFPWPKTAYTGSKYTDGIYERTQMWANSRASIISEGKWTPGANYYDDARELPIKMTVKGQPKRFY